MGSSIEEELVMIRKHVLFIKILRIKKSSKELFEQATASVAPKLEMCPYCETKGCCSVHGYYSRKIIDFVWGKVIRQQVTVLRVICRKCGNTHAVLPDHIIPYNSYGLFFILRLLGEYFAGLHTNEQLCERFGITENQFYKWRYLWKEHKQQWLDMLEEAGISDLSFIKELCCYGMYSDFEIAFIREFSISFLQSHQNPKKQDFSIKKI